MGVVMSTMMKCDRDGTLQEGVPTGWSKITVEMVEDRKPAAQWETIDLCAGCTESFRQWMVEGGAQP
jgi:hypothetical protein